MPRLILIADGPTSHTAQVWLGDMEITHQTRHLSLEIGVHAVTVATLTLLPRDGLEVNVDTRLAVAWLPAPGFRWIEEPLADGTWRVRCEAVPQVTP